MQLYYKLTKEKIAFLIFLDVNLYYCNNCFIINTTQFHSLYLSMHHAMCKHQLPDPICYPKLCTSLIVVTKTSYLERIYT